jgi:hypothetical protein
MLLQAGASKDMANLYEYKDTASFTLFGAPLESQFTRGIGRAYGFEFSFISAWVISGMDRLYVVMDNTHIAELNEGEEACFT